MIVCIESWKGDTYLTGKKIPVSELKRQLRRAEYLYDRQEDNFIPLLCRMYGWEPITDPACVAADYTYDADTGLVLQNQASQ